MTPPLGRTLLTALTLTALTAATPCLSAQAAGTDPWIRAWGDNALGQLGNGSVLAQQTPAAVLGVTRDDVRELAAGGGDKNPFVIALLRDGTVKSWGANLTGQLGNGTIVNQSFPATVTKLSGVSEIAAGVNHALAVKGGRVLAWGDNAKKQLGTGLDATTPYRTPVDVQSLDKVRDVGAGCDFSVALRQDGTVWTWGAGANGRLGTGNATDRATPQQVPDLARTDRHRLRKASPCVTPQRSVAHGPHEPAYEAARSMMRRSQHADIYRGYIARTALSISPVWADRRGPGHEWPPHSRPPMLWMPNPRPSGVEAGSRGHRCCAMPQA
ncbi:hypothetical protein ABT237_28015 [Streptomyces sp. NPDC001581]|uniref:RCC1 domain-containing protein n=1 Tax=Streptomyces sp. NPDC001581 TaxID=3154386 RepID=UPI00331E202E